MFCYQPITNDCSQGVSQSPCLLPASPHAAKIARLHVLLHPWHAAVYGDFAVY